MIYMLMLGAIVLRPEVSKDALMALVVYLAMYMLMNLGVFGATALVFWRTGSDHIDEFSGLGRRAPWLAAGMTVCLFSLVGMPPLGGFLAKWWLLWAMAEQGGWLWWLIIWLSLNTLFSLFYYVRIMNHMYFKDDGRDRLQAPISGVALVTMCALLLIVSGTLWADQVKTEAATYAEVPFEPTAVIDELAQSQ